MGIFYSPTVDIIRRHPVTTSIAYIAIIATVPSMQYLPCNYHNINTAEVICYHFFASFNCCGIQKRTRAITVMSLYAYDVQYVHCL